MPELIVFPDAEAVVRSLLLSALPGSAFAGVTVGTKVPSPRPAEFVRLMRTGGARESLVVDRAQITVEAWAGTEARAAAVLEYCRAVILRGGVASGVQLYRPEEFSGPSNLPDPLSGQVRYTATFAVRLRGTAA